MSGEVPFCTCKYTDCPNHPANHDEGCTRCIAKNLRQGEIPECFFLQAEEKYGKRAGVRQEDYARLVLGLRENMKNLQQSLNFT